MGKKLKFPKIKFPLKIKFVKKSKKNTKNKPSIFKKYKKLFIILASIVVGLFLFDFLVYLFFKTNVLAYSTKSGIIVTKSQVLNRLLDKPEYATTNLQQLINDVAIEQMVKAEAKHNNKFLSKKQTLEELKKQGLKDEEITNEVVRNAQIIMMIEKMLDKKPQPVTEKDMKSFYDQTKDTYFSGKKYSEVKDQIKQYLETQNKQQVILEWIQNKLNKENFVFTKDQIKKYNPGVGINLFVDVIVKHILNM